MGCVVLEPLHWTYAMWDVGFFGLFFEYRLSPWDYAAGSYLFMKQVDAAPIVTAILYPYLQEAASAQQTVAFMMKHYASSTAMVQAKKLIANRNN